MTRRLKRILVMPEILGSMFEVDGKSWECIKGLPPGSVFKGVYLCHESLAICMAFEHTSFEEIEEGDPVPLLSPMPEFKRTDL